MITEDEFWGIWGIITDPQDLLFEFAAVKDHPIKHVWTVVESGDDADGNWYAIPGVHYVNRLGYVLTEKPWEDDTLDAVYFLDDFESDEDDIACEDIGDEPAA